MCLFRIRHNRRSLGQLQQRETPKPAPQPTQERLHGNAVKLA